MVVQGRADDLELFLVERVGRALPLDLAEPRVVDLFELLPGGYGFVG